MLFVLVCLFCCAVGQLQCMVWMCLERCNDTQADIKLSVSQASLLGAKLPLTAFELYNLGPNGQLIVNSDLTNIGPVLKGLGKQTFPMISSYPYPPEFLSWMRQLWTTPAVGASFISQLKHEATVNGWSGFQVDWEPTAAATTQDAQAYANFLSTMAKELAPLRIIPTIATWNSIWNLTFLGESTVYKMVTMSTYATKLPTFESKLDYTLKYINKDLLGVGVENWPDVDEGLEQRFQMTIARGIKTFAVWKMPLQDDWFQLMQKYCTPTN